MVNLTDLVGGLDWTAYETVRVSQAIGIGATVPSLIPADQDRVGIYGGSNGAVAFLRAKISGAAGNEGFRLANSADGRVDRVLTMDTDGPLVTLGYDVVAVGGGTTVTFYLVRLVYPSRVLDLDKRRPPATWTRPPSRRNASGQRLSDVLAARLLRARP